MSKINEQDRRIMAQHLRDLSRKAIIANAKHSKNIDKQISHTIELTKFIKEDRAQIQRLNNVIDIKQREIDELNETNTNQLWDLAKLEKRCSELEKRVITEDIKRAEVQKKIKENYSYESTDN
jgi:hypothetical protein